MAVAFVLDFTDGSYDQYDQVIEKMGLTPGGPGGPGSIFHWVTKTDGGIRVTDVWESPEHFQRFADEQIGPLSAQVGLAPPTVQTYEVHNYFTAG